MEKATSAQLDKKKIKHKESDVKVPGVLRAFFYLGRIGMRPQEKRNLETKAGGDHDFEEARRASVELWSEGDLKKYDKSNFQAWSLPHQNTKITESSPAAEQGDAAADSREAEAS